MLRRDVQFFDDFQGQYHWVSEFAPESWKKEAGYAAGMFIAPKDLAYDF